MTDKDPLANLNTTLVDWDDIIFVLRMAVPLLKNTATR